jgi:hypothetical protein
MVRSCFLVQPRSRRRPCWESRVQAALLLSFRLVFTVRRRSVSDSPEKQGLQPTRQGSGERSSLRWASAVLVAAGFLGYRYFASSGAGEIRSIAVLPFQNRNSDADTEYLSDGLAESLIYRLSQIPDLKVSPRSSVFRYKGQDADAGKWGRNSVSTR